MEKVILFSDEEGFLEFICESIKEYIKYDFEDDFKEFVYNKIKDDPIYLYTQDHGLISLSKSRFYEYVDHYINNTPLKFMLNYFSIL